MEKPQSAIRELHQTYYDGIRKTLWWLVGTDLTYIRVEDDKVGGNFSVDVPAGRSPLEFMGHVMAHVDLDRPLGLGQPPGKEAWQ